MAATDAQKRATNKYLERYEDIKIRVPLGERKRYKEYAASKGTSLTRLIINLLEADIEKSKNESIE